MEKILYITANSKPENLSSSKTVGRALVNRILAKYPELQVEELDLYNTNLPLVKSCYFASRSKLIDEAAKGLLPQCDQDAIGRINQLTDQFVSASVYVLAAPMWSLSYPAVVKQYIDCVMQAGKTIVFEDNKPTGILNDRPRTFIYVQSSGAAVPWMLKPVLNKGLNYVIDVMKFVGITKTEELLVDGTGTSENERQKAISDAEKKIDSVVNSIEL